MKEKLNEVLIMFQEFKWEGGLLYKKDRAICNYFPLIIKKAQNTSTGKVIYQLALFIGETEEPVIGELAEEEISQVGYYYFRKLSDRCVNQLDIKTTECKAVMEYIICRQIAEIQKVFFYVEELGWHTLPDGSHIYCMGNRYVVAENHCKNHEIMISSFLAANFAVKIEELMTTAETFKLCRMFLMKSEQVITIFILSLAVAYLRTLYIEAGVSPDITLFEYGPTATGKTVSAKYFCSFYGSSDGQGGMMAELESTKAAIERKASVARDCFFLVDDLAPGESKRRTNEKKEIVSTMIRRSYSGLGAEKSVGKQNCTSKTNALLVFTAEEMLDNTSTMNRTIFIKTTKLLKEGIREKMKKNPHFSKSLAYHLIVWAVYNYDKVVQKIRKCDQEFRKKDFKNFDPRIQSSMRILHIAKALLLECAKCYSQEELSDCSKQIDCVCSSVLKEMKERIKQMQASGRNIDIAEYVISEIKNNKLGIADSCETYEQAEWFDMSGEYAGFRHKNNIYLVPDVLRQYLQKKLGREISACKISRDFTSSGILIRDKSTSAQKKFDGERYWVLDGSIVLQN